MSSVLITGGLGVIGSWVTRNLAEQGVRVVTYDSRPDTTLVKDIIEKVDCVTGDVLDMPNLLRTIKYFGVERIIHLATAGPPSMEANPFGTYKINVDGAMNVLEAARLMDIKRVVCASSQAVYELAQGEYGHPTYKPTDEDYPKAPKTVYGVTKLFIENMCFSYKRLFGLDIIILRFGSTYGPRKQQAGHGMVALASQIIESAMLRKPLKIPQGGDQIMDMVYNRDLANGIVLACFAENLKHHVFQLGTGKGETLQHLVEILDKIFGGVPIEIGPGLDPWETSISNYLVLNINRARRELNYSPQYDLEAGVGDYIKTMERLDISPVVLALS